MNRSNPYPLLFDKAWKHLYCDALLTSNNETLSEIQINDINMFNVEDQAKFQNRVLQNVQKILPNLMDKMGEKDVFIDDDVIQELTMLLLKDEKEGVVSCLIKIVKDNKMNETGSLRSQVMQSIIQAIQEKMIEILPSVFQK